MDPFSTIFKIVGAIKEVLDWLFGDDGLSEAELRQALAEAVNEIGIQTQLIVSTQIEWHEYQLARNQVQSLALQLQEYARNAEEWRLEDLTKPAADAWAACDDQLHLIDNGGTKGIGLLGHPLFLTAAGLRLLVLQEWVRFHADNGSSDKEEEARDNLRDALVSAIDIARGMENEWIDWTELRFKPISKQANYQGLVAEIALAWGAEFKFQWVYRFNGQEILAGEVSWEPGDNLDKIQEAALSALDFWLERREQEIESVREAFVNPSKQVRAEWADALDTLGPKIGGIAKVYPSIEEAMDAADVVHLLAESFWEAHPEVRADRVEHAPVATKPSLIGKRPPAR